MLLLIYEAVSLLKVGDILYLKANQPGSRTNEGKLTNIRAATFYEENLPFVQTRILEKLFS